MDKAIRRIYECPICTKRHHAQVGKVLDRNMRVHFPLSYGRGKLLCGDCLVAKLEQIKKL